MTGPPSPPNGTGSGWWLGRAILGRVVLAILVVGGIALPKTAGSDYRRPPPAPRAAPPSNPVGELFAAVSRCRASLPEADRWQIANVIHEESSKYGYDPLFVLAMAQVESTCSPTARGKHGAIGLIQLMPSTARPLAKEIGMKWRGADMLKRPVVNVRLGLRYLWKLERQFRDPFLAMAAYNMGPGRVARMASSKARTGRYVRKILANYETLLKRYGSGRI